MTERYLEEFAPGQKFASGQLKVDRERIKSFAAEFDPSGFTSTKTLPTGQCSRAWPRAAGTPRP